MEQLVTIEVAKLAKELGFNIPVYYHYSENPVNNLTILCEPNDPQLGNGWNLVNYNVPGYIYPKYSAPSQAVLAKWLREKKDIYISMSHWIKSHENGSISILYVAEFIHSETYHLDKLNWVMGYEDVLENALLKALEYLRKLSQENQQKKEPKKM